MPSKLANLDFEARFPIPFSIFPSSYRNDATTEATQTRVEGEVNQQRVGREDRYSSFELNLPHKEEDRPRRKEEVRVYEERDRNRERDRHTQVEFSRDR